jgi:hypothetical protein
MPNHGMRFFLASAALAAAAITLWGAGKIAAQKIVEEALAAHPEIIGLELAATHSDQEGCKTIAATEAKEVGQKCDKEEFTAIKTNRPFVEQEKDQFDVTLPIHDSAGKIIATAGMDFKACPGQTKDTVTRQAKQIAADLEKRIPSTESLFEPAK